MSKSKNQVVVRGFLGADAEVKFLPSGQAVANLRLATSESWTGKDGGRQERTEWHRVVLWGKRAESLGKYLTKGRFIEVEGKLQTRSYERKVGTEAIKVYVTEIVGLNVDLLDKAPTQGGNEEGEDLGSFEDMPIH